MAKKIVRLNRYRKSGSTSTSDSSADVLAFPVQKQEPAPTKEVSWYDTPEFKAELKEKCHQVVGGILDKQRSERQQEIDAIKAGIRKMLNGEAMGVQRKKRLNKLLTNGLYFMLYEYKRMADKLSRDARYFKKLSGDPLQVK